MSRFFAEWRPAREYAEEQTARLKVAHGIERVDNALERGFVVRMLPRPENRQGWELRCEAVEVGEPRMYPPPPKPEGER